VTDGFDAYVRRQRWTDVVINIVLIALPNWLLMRHETAVPLWRRFGDTAPSLMGTLVSIAFLLSLLLTVIVYGVTVAQRKSGKVEPVLPVNTRWFVSALKLAVKHIGIVFLPTLLAAILLQAANIQAELPPVVVVAIATIFGAVLAYVESAWTTRATLSLPANN
jgi:hypothetical protein